MSLQDRADPRPCTPAHWRSTTVPPTLGLPSRAPGSCAPRSGQPLLGAPGACAIQRAAALQRACRSRLGPATPRRTRRVRSRTRAAHERASHSSSDQERALHDGPRSLLVGARARPYDNGHATMRVPPTLGLRAQLGPRRLDRLRSRRPPTAAAKSAHASASASTGSPIRRVRRRGTPCVGFDGALRRAASAAPRSSAPAPAPSWVRRGCTASLEERLDAVRASSRRWPARTAATAPRDHGCGHRGSGPAHVAVTDERLRVALDRDAVRVQPWRPGRRPVPPGRAWTGVSTWLPRELKSATASSLASRLYPSSSERRR